MIILDSPYKTLQINLSGAATTNEFIYTTSFVDTTNTTFSPGEQDGVTTDTANVVVLNPPTSGTSRQLKFLSIYNNDTVTNSVNLYIYSGTTSRTIGTFSLPVSSSLIYDNANGFQIFPVTNNSSGVLSITAANSNIGIYGTGNYPTISLGASPSVNNLNISGTTNATTISATTIISGSTNLYNIFQTQGSEVISVEGGSNIITGGTSQVPTISLAASPSVNNLNISGTTNANIISTTTLSAATMVSGATNLYNIFQTQGSEVIGVEGGSNIITGGTAQNPIINLIASPSINNLNISGTTNTNIISANTSYTTKQLINATLNNPINPERLLVNDGNIGAVFSNTIVGSANTNNYSQITIVNASSLSAASADIVAQNNIGNENVNYIDLGINSSTYNAGSVGFANDAYLYSTANNLYIGNGTPGKSIYFFTDTLTSGTGNRFSISSASTTSYVPLSAATLSASTIISGSTNLYNIFQQLGTNDVQTIGNGSNIITGGTITNTTVNLVSSPSINGLTISGTANANIISATTFSANTITPQALYLPAQNANPSAPSSGLIDIFSNKYNRIQQINSSGIVTSLPNTYIDIRDYGVKFDSVTDDTLAWNTALASIGPSTTILCPVGYSIISSALTIGNNSVYIKGAGMYQTYIDQTSLTADTFQVTSAGFGTFDSLGFVTFVTKTAGYSLNFLSAGTMCVTNCSFSSMYNNVLVQNSVFYMNNCDFINTINNNIVFNSSITNSQVGNCVFNGATACNTHILCQQSGSLIVENCDMDAAVNDVLFNPGVAQVCASIYFTNTFFDKATGSAVKFSGAGTTQDVKFANCWFGSSNNGVEFASSGGGVPNGIVFGNCIFYANTLNGILATNVQDFIVSDSEIAGNGTAGINIFASAGSATKFLIQGNKIGPTRSVGGNGIGILINPGSYGEYLISGNDVVGNTSGITNNGTAPTGQIQNNIFDNVGHLIRGGIAATTAASAAINTTETIIAGGVNTAVIPANSLQVGTTVRIIIQGTCTSTVANVSTFTLRMGTAGTTADASVATGVVTATTSGTNNPFKIEILFTVRTIGATGTIAGSMTVINNGAIGIAAVDTTVAALTATATLNTTTANYLSLTYKSAATTTTATCQNGIVEIVKI